MFTHTYIHIYIHTYITAPIAQWLERGAQEAGGPGFDPHRTPRPPLEQTPVVKVKTPRVSNK